MSSAAENPYDYDTGPFRHYSNGERTGKNLANSGHFARRHLGDCDLRVMNNLDECYFRNPSNARRCECTQENIRCCSRTGYYEPYCLECKMFCLKISPPEEREPMDVKLGRVAKAVVAAVVSVLSILATVIFADPNQAQIVVSILTTILVTLGVYQVPNKP